MKKPVIPKSLQNRFNNIGKKGTIDNASIDDDVDNIINKGLESYDTESKSRKSNGRKRAVKKDAAIRINT